jgi:hypothetical protein
MLATWSGAITPQRRFDGYVRLHDGAPPPGGYRGDSQAGIHALAVTLLAEVGNLPTLKIKHLASNDFSVRQGIPGAFLQLYSSTSTRNIII